MGKLFLVILLGMFVVSGAFADQRFETVGGFCHWVTVEGFTNNNDDNEVFFANCENSIRQNQDGTGTGSTVAKVKYPAAAMPFVGEHEFTGAGTGIDCVMVDSNGTQYVTQDWTATYTATVEDLNKFKRAFGTQEGDRKYNLDFDFNEDGVINTLDLSIFRSTVSGKVVYSLACFNGAQQ